MLDLSNRTTLIWKIIYLSSKSQSICNENDEQLQNVATGVIADDIEEDLNNGGQLHQKVTGHKYTDVILRKSDQLKTSSCRHEENTQTERWSRSPACP